MNSTAIPGGYSDTDWMTRYGGVPTEAQVDGYLNQIAASSNQKTTIVTVRSNNHGHQMPINKIKDFLNATS